MVGRVPVELTVTVDMAGLALDDPKSKPVLAGMELANPPSSCFDVETEEFCKTVVELERLALSILDFKTLAPMIPESLFV